MGDRRGQRRHENAVTRHLHRDLGIGINGRSAAFIEFFGDFALSDHGSPSHSIDGGFTFLLTETLQLDLAGGVGLSDAAADWFVGAGIRDTILLALRSLADRFPRTSERSVEHATVVGVARAARAAPATW